jgi:hypothetical protein
MVAIAAVIIVKVMIPIIQLIIVATLVSIKILVLIKTTTDTKESFYIDQTSPCAPQTPSGDGNSHGKLH